MTRYRAEFYDKDFNFISYCAVSDKNIQVDYLVNDISTLTIPEIVTAHVNNFVAVRQDGQIYMYGIVSDVAYDRGQTTISFVHFMSLLDVSIMADPRVFDNTPVEQWLVTRLTDLYSGSDLSQNLTGFSADYSTSTIIPMQYEVDENNAVEMAEINIYTFVQELLTKHDIILKWEVDFADKTVECHIGKLNTQNVWNVKLGLADTPDYTIDIHTIEGSFNKIKYYNTADFTDTVTYYLHSDGTVNTDGTTDRLTPVHYCEKTATADDTEGEEKTFAEVALIDAQSAMLNTDFNHEIIVTFNTDSKILSVGQIGQLYNLITPEGVVYSSILTGFEQVNAKYLKLVFGYIRTNLTTILKMQRRKK